LLLLPRLAGALGSESRSCRSTTAAISFRFLQTGIKIALCFRLSPFHLSHLKIHYYKLFAAPKFPGSKKVVRLAVVVDAADRVVELIPSNRNIEFGCERWRHKPPAEKMAVKHTALGALFRRRQRHKHPRVQPVGLGAMGFHNQNFEFQNKKKKSKFSSAPMNE
jgi:hypothetical protein